MAYILALNPNDFNYRAENGLRDAVFTATALAAAIGSIVMGLIARYPNCSCSRYGIKCILCFCVLYIGMGIPWQTALSGVLVSGIIFVYLSLSGIREKIINAIPVELKYAVGAGIGLFIAFVGLQNAGLIVDNPDALIGR